MRLQHGRWPCNFFPKNENAVDSEGKNHRLRRRDDEDRERLSQREKKKAKHTKIIHMHHHHLHHGEDDYKKDYKGN